jgi:hypothetical protein
MSSVPISVTNTVRKQIKGLNNIIYPSKSKRFPCLLILESVSLSEGGESLISVAQALRKYREYNITGYEMPYGLYERRL